MRGGGSVQAEGTGLLLKGAHTLHHGVAFLGNRAEHLQEGTGVHGMGGLDGEGVVAVGDIGHCLHSLRPHAVHGFLQGCHLVFQGRGVPEGIDLIDETGHAGALAEQPFHVGKLHMAVRIHKAGAQDAVIHRFLGRANAGAHDGAVLLHFHKGVAEGLPAQGIYIFCSESFHSVSR